MKPFGLVILLIISTITSCAASESTYLLTQAKLDIQKPAKGDLGATWYNDLLLLRRSWLLLPKVNSFNDQEHRKIKETIVLLFEKMKFHELEMKYKNLSCYQIDCMIRDKYESGKSVFRKDWRVLVERDQSVVIKRLNSSVRYTFKPKDPRLDQIREFINFKLVGREEPVGFDISAIVDIEGPSSYPVW